MASIELTGITKAFGATPVLTDVDLAVKAGEFVTLVGPSGCGKSTLLRILAGLEAQDAGDVTIAGRCVNGVRGADRNLAMVFQSYALYPHLTVAENMMTPLRLRDLRFAERLPILGPLLAPAKHRAIHAQVREAAQGLEIDALLDRKPGQLSGGQRQRVALGRAIVRKPLAFLMDEPLSNLDAALRVHMRAELAELHRALGATFIYVTHDQAEALTMSDRMAVMMAGEILQFDVPQRIYDDPEDLRVARFVGSPQINVLPGEIDRSGRLGALGRPLGLGVEGKVRGPVQVGLRPEHLGLAQVAGPHTFTGEVVHREHLGADAYLHLSLEDGAHRLVVRAEPHAAMRLQIGATAHAERKRDEVMVFAVDGRRLRLTAGALSAVTS